MKVKIVSATTLTIAAISLALVGASPAVAKHKHHSKAKAEKSGCASKNGCSAAMKGDKDKAKGDEKTPDAKSDKK